MNVFAGAIKKKSKAPRNTIVTVGGIPEATIQMNDVLNRLAGLTDSYDAFVLDIDADHNRLSSEIQRDRVVRRIHAYLGAYLGECRFQNSGSFPHKEMSADCLNLLRDSGSYGLRSIMQFVVKECPQVMSHKAMAESLQATVEFLEGLKRVSALEDSLGGTGYYHGWVRS